MEDLCLTFTDEQLRVAANLAQRYDAWAETVRRLQSLPTSMYFAPRGEREYLIVKRHSRDNGTSEGARDEATERRLVDYQVEREAAQRAVAETEAVLGEIVAIYRTLKLPLAMPKPARLLREIDLAGLLGTDVMAVGTNAFAVYQLEAAARFSKLSDETEDFDLAWCRGSGICLAQMGESHPSLIEVLRRVDKSFHINRRRPYQALDKQGYEVELLVAPSLFKTRPRDDAFSPIATLPEQEWLLQGRPVRHVIVSRDAKPCPIFAPDPRWMALHKLWLSEKPERTATKKPKDRQQGDILLKAVVTRMQSSYPVDTDFVMDLPEELRGVFDNWALSNSFMPMPPTRSSMR